jgi:hypothetical protein
MNFATVDLEYTPIGNPISTAVTASARSNVNNAEKVLVINGNDKKKKISINYASGTEYASFILQRFQQITVIKKPTMTIYGMHISNSNAGFTADASNLTLQKVIHYNAD